MKKQITEEQAQLLANLTGCFVCQDEYTTKLTTEKPIYGTLFGQYTRYGWLSDMKKSMESSDLRSTTRVLSDRKFEEQIWHPKLHSLTSVGAGDQEDRSTTRRSTPQDSAPTVHL